MEDDLVEWTADARLELAVEISEFHRSRGWIPKKIKRAIERHGPGGKCSCFIAAKHIQATEVLNRGEMLDDDLLFRHGDGTLRERHRRNHRQELRCQADCERDSEQQRLQRVAVARNADHQQEENQK